MSLSLFHPAVYTWFTTAIGEPTEVQTQAWGKLTQGQHTLIAAPTGSGKTLAAFLAAIDQLLKTGLAQGLKDETTVLYLSPLKALSNDVQKNLQQPLQGIREQLLKLGLPDVNIRAVVRTGDTPTAERERMRREPPHILVTTPESLYILLTSDSGRRMLSTVSTVIVDEVHTLAGNKRGAHLSLSLERLSELCPQRPLRIGLSATQKPIQDIAFFLIGNSNDECALINVGSHRTRDLGIETTASPLEATLPHEVWSEIYDHLADQVRKHRTTLVFVNNRRLAERAAHALSARLDPSLVAAHHGSLARELRLNAEQRLKAGELKVLVATASLELGIDIGEIDLVCQLGSPRSIASFLQRIGRSGHALHKTPKGRLYPLSRDDLVECVALLDAALRDELDITHIPVAPLDVLSQQIVAEIACRDWEEKPLFELIRRARPYQDLSFDQFTEVLRTLADGYTLRRGRRSAYLHWDRVNRILRPRRGTKLIAVTNGGTIPEQFDYTVVLQPEGTVIGTLNEDFAFESLPGDIFQLGNHSYRMQKIEQGRVYVEDARGQPPNMPFWFGEAPGRTAELSFSVSRLRALLSEKLEAGIEQATAWLIQNYPIPLVAAQQLAEYIAVAKATFGVVPSQTHIVLERFLDETGDMHLVIHSAFGSRINRAWGLALRKRFCRKFNFELQAAASDDSLILSLGATHSFPLDEVMQYLNSKTVRQVLQQAVLAAPLFPARWRWVCNTSLAIPRNRNGKKIPAPFQRNDAEDLLALVFPDQLACQENIVGDRDIPEHPLVTQTMDDCLNEFMDIEGLEDLLRQIETRRVQVICKDLTSPSLLAQEILNARPYAFLDDTPAEERRTRAVRTRRLQTPLEGAELSRLSLDAIQRGCNEAWPEAHTAEELHDALNIIGFVSETELELTDHAFRLPRSLRDSWQILRVELEQQQRALVLTLPTGVKLWVVRERLHELLTLFPAAQRAPALDAMSHTQSLERADALKEVLRSRLECLGPVTLAELNQDLRLPENALSQAMLALEQEGFAIRGQFTGSSTDIEWCEHGLLARIHRYTQKQLHRETEPVPPALFMQFLFDWHHLTDRKEGQDSLEAVLLQLEGYSLPAHSIEKDILPFRIANYSRNMLDNLCTSGRYTWLRLVRAPRKTPKEGRKAGAASNTPVVVLPRAQLSSWQEFSVADTANTLSLSANARTLRTSLKKLGASFFLDLLPATGLLRVQLEEALSELVAQGLVTSDSFAGLRALTASAKKKAQSARRASHHRLEEAGRWSLVTRFEPGDVLERHRALEHVALCLLRRYGCVFRRLLDHEPSLPPWRDLLYVYRLLEARGEVRGGRFVTGFSGEQFALPEAYTQLRELKRRPATEHYVVIAAADPLNLTGLVTPGERIAALVGNRILYRQGVPVANAVAGNVIFHQKLEAHDEWELRNTLLRTQQPLFTPISAMHPI